MKRSLFAPCLSLLVLPVQGSLLAHYDFTDGDLTDNEVGPLETLTLVNQGANEITINARGAAVFPGESGDDRDYLEVERGLGSPTFTVSVWFKTATVDQGTYQAIFSNNISSGSAFSWQIDVHNGVLRLVSATSGFDPITNAEAGEPPIQAGVWHHVVVRKTSGSSGELWFGAEGSPLQLLGSNDLNPGGLQWFRLGVNRNSDSLYAMEMANVKIYDDIEVSLSDLNNEGPQLMGGPTAAGALDLEIKPNEENEGAFDFSWTSREGQEYDLVSSADLSTAPESWAVWQGLAGLAATAPQNTLQNIPGNGATRRFFALIERDSSN